MKLDLNKAALFLLVESEADETAEDFHTFLCRHYDRRENDPNFGPLYQVGPLYDVEGRSFFQVQTFAGSLGARMMLAVHKGEFRRAIVLSVSGAGTGFELIEPGGSTRSVGTPLPK